MIVEYVVFGFIIIIPSTLVGGYKFDHIEFCPLYFLPIVDSNWNSLPTANGKDAISSSKIFYDVNEVFHPGNNVLQVSVQQGAPCIVVCTVVSERCNTISTVRLLILSAMKAYPIPIHFEASGLYRAVCRFKNKVNTMEASRIIVVGTTQHPLMLHMDRTMMMGENIEVKVSLGVWEVFLPRLAANIQAFTEVGDGQYYEAEMKAFDYTITDNHVFHYPLKQSGVTILRVNLFLRKSDRGLEYIQFVRSVMVVDYIEEIKLLASCTSIPGSTKTVLLKHESTAELVLPLDSTVDMKVSSNNFVTEWGWIVGENAVSDSNTYSFKVESHNEITIVGKNGFSELRCTLIPSRYVPAENILVYGKNIVAVNESCSFFIVLTSTHSLKDFVKNYRYDVSVTVSKLKASPNTIEDSTRFLNRNQMTCYVSASRPLHYLNDVVDNEPLLQPTISYCQYKINVKINDYGSYTVSAKAAAEDTQEAENYRIYVIKRPDGLLSNVPVCVSEYSRCRPPRVEIVNPRQSAVLEFQHGSDILIFGKYFHSTCEDKTYRYSSNLGNSKWEITRYVDESENQNRDYTWPNLTTNGLEFYASSGSMPVGMYTATVQLTENNYCGSDSFSTTDSIIVRVVPEPVFVKILGGSGSLIYVIPSSVLILKTLINYPEEIPNLQWHCRLYDDGKSNDDISNNDGATCFKDGFEISDAEQDRWSIVIPLQSLADISSIIVFTITAIDDSADEYSHNQMVDLELPSDNTLEMLKLIQQENQQPRIMISCVSNCQTAIVRSKAMDFRAKCEPCRSDTHKELQLSFSWSLFHSSKEVQFGLPSSSKLISKSAGYPDFRVKPFQYGESGFYRLFAKLVGTQDGVRYNTLGESYYDFRMPNSTIKPTCYISPLQGIAMVTKYKLACNYESPDVRYEMYVAICHNCEKDDSRYVLFDRIYQGVYEDIVFPVGDANFGFKLSIKITVTSSIGKRNDIYVFVVSKPPDGDFVTNLLDSFSTEESGAGRTDVTKFFKTANAYLSLGSIVQNETLKGRVVQSILKSVTTMEQSSPNIVVSTSQILTMAIDALSTSSISDEVLKDSLNSIEETVQKQLKWISNQNTSLAGDDSAARAVLGTVIEGIRLTTSIKDGDAPTIINNFQTNLNEAVMKLSDSKLLGEDPTTIVATKFKLEVAKTEFQHKQTIVRQQRGLILDYSSSTTDRSSEHEIKSGLVAYLFNPVSHFERFEDTVAKNEEHNVVEVILDAADSRIISRVQVLLPITANSYIQTHTISLPQPCHTKAEIDNTPCGAVSAEIALDFKSGGRHTGNAGFYVILRLDNPCRFRDQPCINATLQRPEERSNEYTVCQEYHNASGCSSGHHVTLHETFPIRHAEAISPEFAPDPWIWRIEDEFADTLYSNDNPHLRMSLEYLQNLSYYDSHIHKVSIAFVRASCSRWDEVNTRWSSESCQSGHITTGSNLPCSCRTQPLYRSNGASPGDKTSTMFQSSVFIIPNDISANDFIAVIGRIQTQHYVVTVIISFCVAFLAGYFVAIRVDRKQEASRGTVIPPGNNPNNDYLYEVVVSTAALRGSGTSANVTMILKGDNGTTSDPQIISSIDRSTLQRSGRDSFLVPTAKTLGQVDSIHLSHDNAGSHPSWHVNGIAVFDLHDSSRPPSYFVLNTWISLDIYPYHCSIVAKRSTESEITSFTASWKLHITYFLQRSASWWSIYFKPHRSVFSYKRRLACLATEFFGHMLITNMFIEAGSQYYYFKLGYVEIDLSPLVISFQSALVTLPLAIIRSKVFNGLDKRKEAEISRIISLSKKAKESSRSSRPKVSVEGQFRITRTASKEVRFDDETAACYNENFDLSKTLQDCIEIKRIAQRISSSNTLNPGRVIKRNGKTQINNTSLTSELHGITREKSRNAISQNSILNYILPRRFRSRTTENSHTKLSLKKSPKGNIYGHEYKLHGKQDDADEDAKKAQLLEDVIFLPKGFVIPRWLSKFVWGSTVVYLTACIVISSIYGIGYDSDQFVSWLVTFLITVVQSMFLISFIQFSIITALYTGCVKKVHHYLWVPDCSSIARAEAVLMWRIKRKRLQNDKNRRKRIKDYHSIYNMKVQPDLYSASDERLSSFGLSSDMTNFVSKMRYAIAVKQVKRYWKESVSRILLAIFLSILVFSQIDPEFKKTNFTAGKRLRQGVQRIKSQRDIFSYLENDVFPLIYKTDRTMKDDDANLLGTIRLRQLRFSKTIECGCFLERICDCARNVSYGESYDQGNYLESWVPIAQVTKNYRDAFNVWMHHTTPDAEHSWLYPGTWVLYNEYNSGGGYAIDTGYTINEAEAISRTLSYLNWVDERTAIFVVDFSTFTMSSGCVTSHLSVIEYLPTGAAKAFHQSYAYRPIYVYDWGDIFTITFQLCHLTTVCIQMYLMVAKCVEVKWHPLAVIKMCTDVWNLIDILSYIITVTAYVFYFMHIYYSSIASGILYHNPTKFASFTKPVYYKIMYLNFAAFCIFINYVRLLKIARGSRVLSHVTDSITVSLSGISISSVSFLILIFVFTITGLVLPASSWSKGNVLTTFTHVCYLATFGSVQPPPPEFCRAVWWKIYIYAAVVCIFVFHSKLIVIVLIRAFKTSRNCRNGSGSPQAETFAIHWLYETICRFFGIKSMAFSGKRVSLRAPPGTILHRKIPDSSPSKKRW